MTDSEVPFVNACRAATDRLWMHRKALQKVAVRIGFWPTGMVIGVIASHFGESNEPNSPDTAPARQCASPPPLVIPWDQVHALTEEGLVKIIDDYCLPLYSQMVTRQ